MGSPSKLYCYILLLNVLQVMLVGGTLYHTEEIVGPEGCTFFVRPYSQKETEQHYLSKLKENDKKLLSLRAQMAQLIMERKQIKNELSKLNSVFRYPDIAQQVVMNQTHGNGTIIQWEDGVIIQYYHHQKSSAKPTNAPTVSPTISPTRPPTDSPTDSPTSVPTESPTMKPTTQPTDHPTLRPTRSPTTKPTKYPTTNPTQQPTKSPTNQWDVTSPNKPKRKKGKSAKSLAETAKQDDALLNQLRLKHQKEAPPASPTLRLSTSVIEIHEITPNEPQSFKDYTIDKISGNEHYDYIITKYYDDQFMNSSMKIGTYYENIDKLYDDIIAIYSLLLMEGPTLSNLHRFSNCIDEFLILCPGFQLDMIHSFYKLDNRTSMQIKNDVMREKLKSERAAKFLALHLCEEFFFIVHEIKIMEAKRFLTTSEKEWDHRRDLLKIVFNTSRQVAKSDKYDTTQGLELKDFLGSRSEIYLPSVNHLNDLIDEVIMYKDGFTISKLYHDWRLGRTDTGKSKICVIVANNNALFLDNYNDTVTSIHSVNLESKGRRKQRSRKPAVKVKELSF